MKVFKKEIFKNILKLNLKPKDLHNKTIMNIGSGREAIGFLQFDIKEIDHFDISKKNVLNLKKILKKKRINRINSNLLDLSKNKLPKNKYDIIYLHGIIQHVDFVNRAVLNIVNSLKENGICWFYFYRPGSLASFLVSIQRKLLKKFPVNNFIKKLNNTNLSFKKKI